MGMAASQARYLALTARKTNTEWEGQQINQARTALANQSANLFNRLLNMEVPNAPKTTDYTELQYSYSDGDNESVLESWQKLSTADPEYNYVVTHYYLADIYTGSKKLLQDPQVQVDDVLKSINFNKETDTISGDISTGVITVTTKEGNNYEYTKITDAQVAANEKLKEDFKSFATAKNLAMNDGIPLTDNVYGYLDSSNTWHFFMANEETLEPMDYNDYYMEFSPSYVGNSKLTELTRLAGDEEVAELAQILRDCPDSSIKDYLSFDGAGNLQYNGKGIYAFDLFGKTYFTTQSDLDNSVGKPYDKTKPIEQQPKLAYYNASYISQRIEETNNALLETDGEGRFKSVKFDNDSVVYSLNVETVTDEAAYQDAMNEYLYKKEVYEKTIADINAKTSIIQKEDRTLELRLKQLDTEQLALKTEMDAVQKVIKDNVEKTFKTFSD